MTILLTPEQQQIYAAAVEPVQIVDAQGHLLGVLEPRWSKEELGAALAATDEPTGVPYSEVKLFLAHLEETERREGQLSPDRVDAEYESWSRQKKSA